MNKSRWDEIIAVSARLFREKGYRATTMDDIACELNVTKPALYYYIKTKHDLLYAICKSAIERLMEGMKSIMAEQDDIEEQLRRLISWHVNMFSERGDVITVYLAEESELPEEERGFIRSQSRDYEALYRQLLERGIEEGRFRDLDVPMVVRAISGMCNWLFAWYRQDGASTADEIAEIFFDLMMKGCISR
ncbi:MAG: TetR/AcrR family transcriptional regulator [Actinobacteria bacterium]|jgi:AcrR family transcriptional regulator|nr:MAG: TetR/AcrR family transcriptional regulator [Actinomycetota bacterium]